MYHGEIIIDSEEACLAELGTPRKLLNPRRILPPPSPLQKQSARERRRWERDYPARSALAAVRSGEILPTSLAEWKRAFWGSEKISEMSLREFPLATVLSFQSDSLPRPLLEETMRIPGVRAAAVFADGDAWVFSARGVQRGLRAVARSPWRDYWSGRARSSIHLPSGWQESLRQGEVVRGGVPGGSLSLQVEDAALRRADFVLDDTDPLDDVLLAWQGNFCILLDPEN